MTVKPEGSNIGVNIGIDKFYGATQDGISYDDVVDKAVKAISDGFINQPQIDVAYHYDSQAKIFELGEKFVERQSERGEQDIEKEEKAAKSKGGEAI